jgi:hypothetical protein
MAQEVTPEQAWSQVLSGTIERCVQHLRRLLPPRDAFLNAEERELLLDRLHHLLDEASRLASVRTSPLTKTADAWLLAVAAHHKAAALIERYAAALRQAYHAAAVSRLLPGASQAG